MSGQDWPVGTVATATVDGVSGVRVYRMHSSWYAAQNIHGDRLFRWHDVTDVRPLVVLDLDDTSKDKVGRGEPAKLVAMLREAADEFWIEEAATLGREVADQIEAQTKPPRIPEPGLWGVVEASVRDSVRLNFVHSLPGLWLAHAGGQYLWTELVDPVLIRPGIEDES